MLRLGYNVEDDKILLVPPYMTDHVTQRCLAIHQNET